MIIFEVIFLPAPSHELLKVLKNVSYFNIAKNEQVQLFLRAHVFPKATAFQEKIMAVDSMTLMLVGLGVALIVVLGAKHFFKSSERVEKLKDKIMWNSFFRS